VPDEEPNVTLPKTWEGHKGENEMRGYPWLPVVAFFICHRLAKEKGKNVTLWTVLGIIPVVNTFALAYLVGAVNALLEKKVDRLLSLLEKKDE
jgi:hypothetical protein